jgi:hypothetical protein
MRRRLAGLLLSALIALAVVLPAAPALADAGLVLAAEATDGPAEPLGPEPKEPNNTDNPVAPAEYEANFLWGAAVGLLALGLGMVLLIGGLYYLLVLRPRQAADRS